MAARQELIDWFKSNQSSGYTRQQLIEFLLIQGYDKNEVYEAAETAFGPEKAPPQKPESQPQPAAPKPAEPSPGAPPPEPEQPKPGFKIPYTLIGVIVVLAILAAGAYQIALMLNLFGVPAGEWTEITANTSGETPPPANYTPPVQPQQPSPCQDASCFNESFKNCTPGASLSATLGILGSQVTYRYEILGPSADGRCAIESEFTANPNPQLIGKQMVCNYNNSKDFTSAVAEAGAGINSGQNTAQCHGELYVLMGGQIYEGNVSSNCTLKSPVSSLEFKKGTTFGFSVSGFQGKSTEVSWKSLDESVVSVSPSSGSLAIIKTLKPGLTKILITDNSVGPACTIAINVTVKQ